MAETARRTGHAPDLLSEAELIDLRRRLRRAQGQVGAVITMLDEGRPDRDVIHVLAAATAALNRVGFLVINQALRRCLTDPDAAPADLAAIEKLFLELS